ncbi:MAG: hypothetical protein ABIH89_07995 [Elusimicrobiota bacterium]
MNNNKTPITLLEEIAERYNLAKLKSILKEPDTLLEKDIYISLDNIVTAVKSEDNTKSSLQAAKNIYGSPIFSLKEGFLIKNEPDISKVVDAMETFSFCFKLSPYHVINTLLALIEAQITGFELEELCRKGTEHIESFIRYSLENNTGWNGDHLKADKPVLIMPVGAAGCGKSTFYRELNNVVNISCDNIRYLLFKEFGPCFAPWESCLSWWVVNYLTDNWLDQGYHVFYNGVNTDLEYRSPITMENSDPLFSGMPYDIRVAYFENRVNMNSEEIEELKNINLWNTSIDEINLKGLSPKVAEIITMIKNNYQRTLDRTKEISEGVSAQDPFDVLYPVPAPIIKLFVEQSFERPSGKNVIVIPRKEIPDADERTSYYRKYAGMIVSGNS